MKKELTKKERRELLTRKKLIDAAKKLFRTKGYKNTSVDEIADEALLSKGTFYQYFKSKENLFLATMSETELELLDLLEDNVLSKSFNQGEEMPKNCSIVSWDTLSRITILFTCRFSVKPVLMMKL